MEKSGRMQYRGYSLKWHTAHGSTVTNGDITTPDGGAAAWGVFQMGMAGDNARISRVISELKSRVDNHIAKTPYRDAQRVTKRMPSSRADMHIELRVGCGWCTARANYPCVTSSGGVMYGRFHRARSEAAKGYRDAQRAHAARRP